MAADARIVKQKLRTLLRTVDFETETQAGGGGQGARPADFKQL